MVRIARDRQKNLHFTTQLDESIKGADVIVISVDTPTKARGGGSGYALDTGRFEEVAMCIAKFAETDKIVVEKSTVPVGTGQVIRKVLETNACKGVKFEVLSNPEFLAEGTAVKNLRFPDRILIGSLETQSGLLAAEALSEVYATWVPRSHIITINLFSAELSKFAANALLAQRISSMNALSVICEATGANVQEVAQAVGSDMRIGPHMLRPSFGFGGSCFKKDIKSLVYLCKCIHLDDIAAYWESVLTINTNQKLRSVARIVSRFNNNMERKTIAVLGFSFKENTADTRETCAIDLVNELLREGASVNVYDPWVSEQQIYDDLGTDKDDSLLKVCGTGEEACGGAHAVLVATNWDMFRVIPKAHAMDSCVNGANGVHGTVNVAAATGSNGVATLSSSSTESMNIPIKFSGDFEQERRGLMENGLRTPVSSSLTFQTAGNCNHNPGVESASLDWNHLAKVMKYPRVVFGSGECLDRAVLENMGFDVEIIGSQRQYQ